MTKVEYLGHIVKSNKITTDPEKIKATENFPLFATLKDLLYYRRFVQNYALIQTINSPLKRTVPK